VVPLEFSFPSVSNKFMDYIDYMTDCLFLLDVVFNFRTIYFDSKTEEPVYDDKKIACNYIVKGRFLVDICASFPIDEVFNAISNEKSGNTNLKFLRMLKLVRLLRLGRMITYLRMNPNFKFGVKFA
jgi:hypothetical protein